MKRLMTGLLATMAFVFAVQAQAAEVTWQKDIKPIFDKHCTGCHGADSPEHGEFAKDKKKWADKAIGMRLDTYSHLVAHVGWPDSGALMRRLDDGSSKSDKKAGNMYDNLGTTEAERKANLDIFKRWVGNWNLNRWKDITKEELNTLKIKY
ncbi:MAG: cytochrome C [Desulfuromonadaceae bacterium]|nr:cytochrome C [Desulfuromonadaceae bacterium]